MSIASSIRLAIEDLGKNTLVVDAKSMADYAVRIARGQGQVLRRRKLETGGWEIRAARKHRKQSNIF